jgi:hypothetical protein
METDNGAGDVSFERDVKPLFRAVDRDSMQESFDLWIREDVAERAEAILARLEDGSMPCDGAWPAERVAIFRRWVESGTPS